MTLAANLSKLLAAMRAPVTKARRDRERRESIALPAPLIVALEPRIVYDASAASIGAAAVAPHHAGADVHATSGAREAAFAAADTQSASFARSAGASNGSAGAAVANAASGQSGVQATPRHGYMLAPSWAAGDTSTMRAVQGFTDLTARSTDQQVVFVNSNVSDYQTLVAGLPQGTQVVILDSTKDGLAQIEQYLQQHQGVSAIHLVSHGAAGEFQVGSTWINEADVSTYSAAFAQIGASMKTGGDFLIYGCDVAQNADGKALVQQISSITGLNVAASTDATGASSLGGDWVLEYDAGTVHTGVVFSAASERSYDHVLSAFDETYDGSVGFDSGTTPVASTTLGLSTLTYTGDQAVEYQVVSGSLPSSGSGGELVVNTQGSQMFALTVQRQDGSLMAIESFDIDIFVSNQVTVQGLDGSGNIVGSVVLDITAGATTYTPGHLSSSSLFHVDLSSNAAFTQVKSLKFVETSGNGTWLSPTLDNLTYLAPSSPPTLTASGGTTSFVAGDNVASTPVVIDSGITLTDGNSTTATSATVSITGNLHTSEDVLSFTNTSAATYGNIGASYNAASGVMTLTSAGGTATLAQWQAALRAVTYTDTAVTPSAATRGISFEITSDGFTASNTTTKAVSVTDTDQTPIVTTTHGTTNYSEGAAAITIDSGITVSDADNTTQSSGTVSVSGGFHSGDTLGFTNNGSTMGNIAGSYNAATGLLSLTSAGSTATDAQWANALKAVTFSSTSTTLGARTISFSTSDGTKTSTAATDTINVVSPVQVTTDSGSAAFVAGDNAISTPVAVDSGLTVSDTATTTLASATATITGNYVNGEDFLAFTNNGSTMGNITGSFNQATGVLTLTSAGGTATVAQWQNALRAVTYTDVVVTPTPLTRTISFAATDSLSNTSATATRTVTVTDTDQSPIVTTTGGTTNYVGAASAVTIDGGINVSDLDNATQASGTVSVSGGFHSGDTLSFTNDGSTMGNIVGSYNAATGVLTLTSSGASATDAQWASALKSVTFSSTSTTYGNRTISFATSDGTKTSTAATDTVHMTAPPTITTDSGSAAFVAGDNTTSTPVAIDSGLTVTDGSATTLGSATVAITGGFHSGEDVLAFTNNGTTMGNIAASYNATTGVMTLTSSGNTATLGQWQSALESVTYTDTAVTPNNTTRTISFSAVDGAGNTSATATRTVTVTDTDQTPIVTTTGGTTSYVGASAGVTVDGHVTVSDLDNTTQTSATVAVTTGFHPGDVLSFTNDGATMGNIQASYSSGTGVLLLTSIGGTATNAQWASALSSVTFSSTSTTYGARTIWYQVNDGTKNSAQAADTINMTAPPTITTDSGSAAFVAGDNTTSTPVAIDSGLTVTDGSATTLGSATVAITGGFHSSEDRLAFTNNGTTMGNIAASYNAATGVMTLTSAGSTATLAQWQSALQSVTYTDTAVTPNNTTRTISFTAVDGGGNTSATATRTVTVTDTDQTPIVTATGGTTNYVAGSSAATIDGGITVSDLDNTTQSNGTVSITGGFHSGDTLAFVNSSSATFGNIVGSYNSATGVLTLTSSGATATDAQWASALRAVTFSAGSSATPGNRTVSFATSDGTKTSTAATDTVAVLGPPTITTDSGSAAFVAGDNTASSPVAVDAGLTLTDGSSPTLASATVAVTGNFHSGEDVLAFTNTSAATYGNIAASYNAATGVLTLTSSGATATLAQWQAALDAVTYTDTAVTPNNATRTISFSAVDTGATTSNTATRTVTVTDTDQTPIVATTGGTTNYVAGTSAATIDGGITVSDLDNTTQSSGTVSITGGFHSGDTLTFVNTSSATFGNIVGSYNSATGVLTLTSSGATASDAQWSHALSAVTFSAGSSATTGNRTVSFATSDGTKTSVAATDTVSVLGPPTIVTDSGSAAFVAGDNTTSTPVAIDSGLTVTDGAASTLSSATVAITGNFHSGQDVLAFSNTSSATYGNIAASYNAATGVLTLSSSGNSATLAQWQAALDAVTYTDTAVTPNATTRTISFSVVDTAAVTSNTATRTVTVTDTDQTPIVATTGGTTNYVAGTSAATIDGGITVSDLDNTTQSNGTVSITGGFHSGDTLSFVNTSAPTFGNIVGSYNSATGVLTLTSSGATATDAQWASALSAVTFSAGSTATPGNRTITFTTSDGAKTSAASTKTLDVLGPPTLTTDLGSAAFVAGDNTASTPVTIDSGLTLTDGSSPTLASATVAVTGNFHSGEDVLAFTNTNSTTFGNIAASYNSATGVLTLTSAGHSASLAQWQAAFDAVSYTDTAITPNSATRTISFAALDTGGVTSNTATRTVTVADTDQTPIVTTTGGTRNYVAGTSAATIDGGISVSDRDNTTQSSGTVSITSGFHSGDTLTFVNTSSPTFGNIVGSYNAATGVLTLTSSGGTASDLQWSNALSAVTFSAASTATPGNRTISFTTSDGAKTSTVATDTLDVLGPPQITTDAGSASFVAGDNTVSTPVAIDPGLGLTDSGSPTLASATVAVTGNFHSGEDVLAFSNTSATSFGNLASSYNATTGVLTLSSAGNTATLAQWQAALAAVTYTDTAITPNSATRTISFSATDTGAVTSNTATRTVTVTDTDQTPIVTTTGGTATDVAGRTPVTIDSGVSVSDRDNGTQASATVAITGNFHSGEDVLTFTNGNVAAFGNIAAFYNSTTGVLTLSSAGNTATDAQWSSALSAVTFSTSGTHFGNRTVSFATSDGTKTSASASATVTVLDSPHVGTDTGSAAFVAGDNTTSTPIVVSPHLTLTDGTSTTLASATVSIAGGFHAGEDVLAFRNNGATMGNIAGSYDANTGVLSLTSAGGTATFAQWQAALASITYTDTAITPNNASRTISVTVTDGNGVTSDVQTRNVTVNDTDQTPLLSVGGAVTFTAAGIGSTPVAVAPQVTLSDRDNTTELAAQVSITGGFDPAHDTLAFTGSAGTGNIAASYNAATGVLTLTSAGGTATLAQWQAALQSVTYTDSSLAAGTGRTVTFAISDGAKTSAVASNLVQITNAPMFPPILPPTVVHTPASGPAPVFTGGDNTAPPNVLQEFNSPPFIGSVPIVPTITFADPDGPGVFFSPGFTSVGRFDMTSLDAAISVSSAETSAPLPELSFAMEPNDPFSIEVATLLPAADVMHAESDVTVRLANGRSLPGWVHYDAASGVLRGKMPAGVEDVHIVVQSRDAAGHVTRREVVLAPHGKHGGSHGASHHVVHPKPPGHAERALAEPTVARAARPVGKPSLDQQFAQARAALHVSHPGGAARRI
jgi:hypothetical protein